MLERDARSMWHVAILAVLAPVVQDIGERVASLARAGDVLGVIPVGEDLSAAAMHRSTAGMLRCEGGVEALGGGDLERLHAARERLLVVCFDEEVDVIALHGDVHDAAVVIVGGECERGEAERYDVLERCASVGEARFECCGPRPQVDFADIAESEALRRRL